MSESYPEAEMVMDDELVFDDSSRRRSTLVRRDERPESIVREGELLAGKYRVERIPGRSGLGILVQVRHVDLGQEVVLKFLVPEACAYPEFVQRFVREARSAVKINGEHVARVTDVGRLESGAPYMVREFLRGPDLAEVLKVRGQLPVHEAVDYIIQACEGVAEGHALGVVHRNLRPTTLFITRRSDGTPLVKVTDFAAAESLHMNPFTERAVSLVGTSAIMQSLPYMAPEQIRDPQDVDPRADVYALGAILHELLTGRPVYQADGAPALLAAVAADGAPPVRALRSDAPGELDHVVLRCLAKNRALRYSSMGELVTVLTPFASSGATTLLNRISYLSRQGARFFETKSSVNTVAQASVRPLGPTGTVTMPAVPPPPPPPSNQGAPPASVRPHAIDDLTVTQPLQHYQPLMQEQSLLRNAPAPLRASPPPPPLQASPPPLQASPPPPQASPPPLRASQPPPLRASQPPPLRASQPPPLRIETAPLPADEDVQPDTAPGVANTSRYVPPHVPPSASQTRPTVMPSRRSSLPGGVVRSWAPAEDDTATAGSRRRRMVGIGAVAALATLGIIIGFRSASNSRTAAVAQPASVASAAAARSAPAPMPVVAAAAAADATATVPAAVASAPAGASAAVSAAPALVLSQPAPAVAPPLMTPQVAAAIPAAPPATAARPAPVPATPGPSRAAVADRVSTAQRPSVPSRSQEAVAAAATDSSTRDLFADPD